MLTTCHSSHVAELALAARELDRICDRLEEATLTARALSAQTDWHSRAATEFRTRADAWALTVARLATLAESARWSTARARDRGDVAAALANGCV